MDELEKMLEELRKMGLPVEEDEEEDPLEEWRSRNPPTMVTGGG